MITKTDVSHLYLNNISIFFINFIQKKQIKVTIKIETIKLLHDIPISGFNSIFTPPSFKYKKMSIIHFLNHYSIINNFSSLHKKSFMDI